MSEPSQWGPPANDAAPRPGGPHARAPRPAAPHPPAPHQADPRSTGQYPAAQYPAGQYSTGQYPTAQYPNAPHPTAQHPDQEATTRFPAAQQYRPGQQPTAQYQPAAYRDEYGSAYGDDYAAAYGDDYGSARRRQTLDDGRDDYRDVSSFDRPRRRGQLFAGVTLVFAVIVSVLLGMWTYQMLATVDLVSPDPFGGLASWAMYIGAAVIAAILVFVFALVALVIARPKALAGLGLAASLLLPVGALMIGLWYGGSVLRQNVEGDIQAEGAAVAAQGAAAADAIIGELERYGVDPGPLRDLIVPFTG